MNDYFDRHLSAKQEANEPTEPVEPITPADDPRATAPLPYSAATGTGPALKAAVQELLKYGLVEKAAKPNLYRTLTIDAAAVATILEPLDLALTLDDLRGIAFLAIPAQVAESADEAWSHPLVRRLRLTNEQSLLVAILRQVYIANEQTHGIGADGAGIDLEELQAQFDLYLGDTGSESRNSERLKRVITQLNAHGIVSEPDRENQVRIRPIIVHLADPEQLQLLLYHFQKLAAQYPSSGDADTPAQTDGDTTDLDPQGEDLS